MNTVEAIVAVPSPAVISPPAPAASWGAILAGAAGAAALSLILLALGAGLGLSSISPWSYHGASTASLTVGTIGWLLAMSALASALGGYLAGRLRTRWPDIDDDEAFFRDTAHGFLAWAVATLLTAAVLTSASASMVGTATTAAAKSTSAASGNAAPGINDSHASTVSYFVDMMFRGAEDDVARSDAQRQEATRIVAMADGGEPSPADRKYLATRVARSTGIGVADAEQRVTKVVSAAKLATEAAAAKAREVAERARSAAARLALWVFVSLLLGAFFSALGATWGGSRRDTAV